MINFFFILANGQGTNEVRVRGNVKNSRFFNSINIFLNFLAGSLIK